MPKCSTCKKEDWESTVQYTKRIRLSFDAPFTCYQCTRAIRKKNPIPKRKEKELPFQLISRTYLMRKYKVSDADARKIISGDFDHDKYPTLKNDIREYRDSQKGM